MHICLYKGPAHNGPSDNEEEAMTIDRRYAGPKCKDLFSTSHIYREIYVYIHICIHLCHIYIYIPPYIHLYAYIYGSVPLIQPSFSG